MTTTRHFAPLARDPGRPRVAVVGGGDAYDNARGALAEFDLSPAKDKRVLLKPNAGRMAAPGDGITTDPGVVAAAIDAFAAAGAEVSVGDSPITGVTPLEALEATGIAPVARERGCPVLDLDERPFVEVRIPDGESIQTIKVCAEVVEHDFVVSVPVMKTHMHTGVTLAIKNMKGCLWRRSKIDLHMLPQVEGADERSLDIAIADMSSVLRPHFALIDGTVGMEGLGPSAGTAKPLGLVVAADDAFAGDAVACRLMGKNAADIPHLRIGAQRGYGVLDLDGVDITPDTWLRMARDFASAPGNLSIEFPNVNILDRNSCSACQSTLLLFLRRYGEDLFAAPGDAPVNIAIGKGHEDLPEGTLCIGNCTVAHRDKGIFVSGCPPVASAIRKALAADDGSERGQE